MKRPDLTERVLHGLFYAFLLCAAAKGLDVIEWPWWAVSIPLWPALALFLGWLAASVSDYRTAVRGERPSPEVLERFNQRKAK